MGPGCISAARDLGILPDWESAGKLLEGRNFLFARGAATFYGWTGVIRNACSFVMGFFEG